MIVSHQHKFIFVKGTKVGGTSVEIALTPICGPDDIVTPVTPVDELLRIQSGHLPRNYALRREAESEFVQRIRTTPVEELHSLELPDFEARFLTHMPLARAERMLGPAVDDYRIVCIERNPYAKVISFANWYMQAPAYHRGIPMKFDADIVTKTVNWMIATGFVLRCRNIGRYRRRTGKLEVRVLRFESMASDLADFVRELGVRDYTPALPHAKKGNYKKDPLEILSPIQVAAINELFREEFDYFGYAMA